jgi:hypothetical protein
MKGTGFMDFKQDRCKHVNPKKRDKRNTRLQKKIRSSGKIISSKRIAVENVI